MAKILCIDDEALLREDIVEELQDAGYETIEAEDGKGGLAAIKEFKPDLVLCDITMPEMDGYQLLAELRGSCPEFADLPFVFLSALADADAVKQGKIRGADDYLTKPIDFELMIATVKARLRQVKRMENRKEQQFVKLYTKLASGESKETGNGATPARRRPAPAEVTAQDPAPQSDAAAPTRTEGAGEGAENMQVKEKLAKIAEKSAGKTVASRFQLIAFESMKWELGKRWAGGEELVYKIAKETIQSMISPDDILKRGGDGEYYVCFAKLNESEASVKAIGIAQKIRKAVLEKFNIANVLTKNPDVHSVEISSEEIHHSDDVMSLVVSKLKEAAERAHVSATLTKKEIFETARVQCRRVFGTTEDSPLVVADFDDSISAGIASLISTSNDPEEIAAQIDMLALGQVAELIYQGYLTGKTKLVVAVNFSTLQNKHSSEIYQNVCNELADNVRKALVLNLVNIPKDAMSSKISDMIKHLRTYSGKQMVRIGEPDLGNLDLSESGVSLIALDYRELVKSIENEDKRAGKLVQQAHNGNVKVFVENVPDKESAQKMGSLGADYVALLGYPMSIDTFI